MDFNDIKKSVKDYYPAIILENFFTSRTIVFLYNVLLILFILSVLVLLFSILLTEIGTLTFLTDFKEILIFLTTLLFSVWFFILAIRSFFYSFYFKDLPSVEIEYGKMFSKISFPVASIVFKTKNKNNIILGFFSTKYGREILFRLGLTLKDIENYVLNSKEGIKLNIEVNQNDNNKIGLSDYAKSIYLSNESLADYFFSLGIKEKDFIGTVNWVSRVDRKYRSLLRWWSKKNMFKKTGFGKDWSYGVAYELEKYSTPIEHLVGSSDVFSNFHEDQVFELETILSRSREANALIVGEAGIGKTNIIAKLAKKISHNNSSNVLKNKKVMVLDTSSLIAAAKDKTSLEREIITILNQSSRAGNIIIVFDDFPSFLRSSLSLGVDVLSIVEPYLSSSNVQVIALSDLSNFHNLLEKDPIISTKFESIFVKETDTESILEIVEDKVMSFEMRRGVFFTFPAILEIISDTKRYFIGKVILDKIFDILDELVTSSSLSGKKIIFKEDVQKFISEKVGIPIGSIENEEKETLMNISKTLHERVVGQDIAVQSISSVLRRARSGISNPNRPLGSFLFLGPTGVGKTETSKALAEVFFGDEEKISRIDMSEYQSSDSLNKLIGSFESGKQGILSNMLKDNPHTVLLLDEFEKSNKEVRDLFLQVLDEGIFSDYSGNKINVRNSIIIATSNAGSDLIWKIIKEGGDLKDSKKDIIAKIIEKGVFKPELLNRFDGVVVFHPLTEIHLKKVAKLMMDKFSKRMKKKGIIVNYDNSVINYLISFSEDPEFGARPINRAIQDKVEEFVAKKIIKGDLKEGGIINLSSSDFD